MRAPWTLLALAGLVACEQIEHVDDYQVAPPVAPFEGLCNQCPASAQALRHAPCPVDNDQPTPGGGETYVFAWRSVSVGADPSTLADPKYDVGLDEDCSARPHGVPAWCLPTPPPATPAFITSPDWAGLPDGIDNSLAQRVLAPLIAFSGGGDVDGALSQTFESGQYGELIVVQDWNGTADDNDVTTRFLGSPGTVKQPPAWNGTDVWIPNAPVESYAAFKSYVAGGVLVADTRSIVEDDSTITLEENGKPVIFTLAGRFMVRVATLTPKSMTMILAGRWNLDDALSQATPLSDFLANGDPVAQGFIAASLPNLLVGAADLPLGEAATPGVQCGAISFAVKAQAAPAHIQGWP